MPNDACFAESLPLKVRRVINARPFDYSVNCVPVGHRGTIKNNQALQSLRFAFNRIRDVLDESILEDGSSVVSGWSSELESALDLIGDAIRGERRPNVYLLPHSGGWSRQYLDEDDSKIVEMEKE